VPGFTVGATDPVVWSKGFAVLEEGAYVRGGGNRSITWNEPAVWLSRDGQVWTRHRLPHAIVGRELSMLTWQDGLSVVDQVPRERGWRFRLWSSADGRRWHRAGTFDQRPIGRLDDCAFTYPHVVSTDARILAMASCTPYANGRTRAPVAQLAAAPGREPRAPLWAWTSDDGTHWSRHLVTDRLDPAGTARSPVLVESIGDGFAAIMCCYPPTVWWSDDGQTWRESTGLPTDVAEHDVSAFGAFIGDGRPETWLLMADKPHEIGEGGVSGALGTLWTGDGAVWTEVTGQPDWQGGRIATDGSSAIVVTTKVMESEPERTRVDTLASTDRGRSWSVSEGDGATPQECCLAGVALRDARAVLAGPWGPDSVVVRYADVAGGTP
jgi:hypothetical protein